MRLTALLLGLAFAFLALALHGCGETAADHGVRVDGLDVVVEGEAPLRGLELDLAWDDGLTVTDVVAGADAERLDLVRFKIDGASARVVVADARGISLPARGRVVHVTATGSGALRVTRARGALTGGATVPVEVR